MGLSYVPHFPRSPNAEYPGLIGGWFYEFTLQIRWYTQSMVLCGVASFPPSLIHATYVLNNHTIIRSRVPQERLPTGRLRRTYMTVREAEVQDPDLPNPARTDIQDSLLRSCGFFAEAIWLLCILWIYHALLVPGSVI